MSYLTTSLLSDAVSKGGPGSGPHKVGDRVQRNSTKTPQWKDTPKMRDHNHGVVVELNPTILGKKTAGVMMRSDAQAKILKDPKADEWDKKSAQRGTYYQHKELLPEGKK